jgi:magnesium chelatase family protein
LAARATGGVLFLDEALEFPAVVLDALRQPLESGQLTIHRSGVMAQFPARFQLVLAANPCPCGQFGSRDGSCTCPPSTVRRYQQRLSGPLLDRVDLRVRVDRVSASAIHAAGGNRHSTVEARERVAAARQRSAERLAGTPWALNARVPGEWLRDPAHRLPARLCSNLDDALERGSLSMRGYDRVLRIAWTLADLDGTALPTVEHLGLAAFMRQGARA